ncbi:M15 family metallopeptidase [Thioclava sp. FR2]|uniref:M15 family metallopeptidase n=1 Tax=Thioclava sp. FR2 TaxID=3445780 RepID=UPI003EC12C93
MPEGYVRLSELAPDIAQDIRYARNFNFTEGPVPGYERGECILTSATAAALIRVEARLANNGYGLVVFDCYRPVRAVEFFAVWANQPDDDLQPPKDIEVAGDTPPDQPNAAKIFFPGLTRADLIPKGYIAKKSGHSVGHTVDVGLRLAGAEPSLPDFASAAPCTANSSIRVLETGLDLGTSFDCFSPLSATTAPVSNEARKNRKILADAMNAEGFRGYDAEWWHFRNSLDPAKAPQNFVVE